MVFMVDIANKRLKYSDICINHANILRYVSKRGKKVKQLYAECWVNKSLFETVCHVKEVETHLLKCQCKMKPLNVKSSLKIYREKPA